MQILSFKKDGKYVLQKEEPKIIILNSQSKVLKYEAKRRKAIALINSGFWSYEGLDRPSLKKKSNLAKLAFFMAMIKTISVQEPTQI